MYWLDPNYENWPSFTPEKSALCFERECKKMGRERTAERGEHQKISQTQLIQAASASSQLRLSWF